MFLVKSTNFWKVFNLWAGERKLIISIVIFLSNNSIKAQLKKFQITVLLIGIGVLDLLYYFGKVVECFEILFSPHKNIHSVDIHI